jgi:hypothetical protein
VYLSALLCVCRWVALEAGVCACVECMHACMYACVSVRVSMAERAIHRRHASQAACITGSMHHRQHASQAACITGSMQDEDSTPHPLRAYEPPHQGQSGSGRSLNAATACRPSGREGSRASRTSGARPCSPETTPARAARTPRACSKQARS